MTFQTAEFDGLGRRMKKTVTNSGGWDGTVVYYYDGPPTAGLRIGSSRPATDREIWLNSSFTGRSTSTSWSWCG